jgi:hypothetical protein
VAYLMSVCPCDGWCCANAHQCSSTGRKARSRPPRACGIGRDGDGRLADRHYGICGNTAQGSLSAPLINARYGSRTMGAAVPHCSVMWQCQQSVSSDGRIILAFRPLAMAAPYARARGTGPRRQLRKSGAPELSYRTVT